MKKKIPRRRIDVNVAELDRIIDGAKSTPLSESDSQKLKTALHALAERLLPRSKTEKTSSVFSDPESAMPEPDRQQRDPSTGHGRNGADAYRGAKKVEIAHPKMAHGDRCPDLRQRQHLHAEGAESVGSDCGTGAAGGHRV